TAGDNVFSFQATVSAATTTGVKTLPFTVTDAQSRTSPLASISLTVQSIIVTPGSVVISQIYGGGGNSGSTLKNDFIEIINHSGAPVDLSGWSVQYASATQANWQVTPLNPPAGFMLQPGQYFLIQEAAQGGGTDNLPTPDAT